MESKRLKLLCTGRKGILLPEYPKEIKDLYVVIFTYLKVNADEYIISFKDQDGDECEVFDQETYEAAISEFPSKIVLKLIQKELIISVINPSTILQGKSLMKFFKKRSRTMAIYDLETEKIEYVKLARGISFKEYAAWVDLPSGEIFYCGGGHPISSEEAFIINPYTRSYKRLPNMQYSRHSHAIAYSNGAIYVFGGIQNMLFYGTMTKKCERYILDEEYWEEIADLDFPRGDAGAASKGDAIYILGKGSQNIVQFNSNEINIDLGEDSGGCLIVDKHLIYAFHGSSIKICDINTKKVIEKIQLPGNKSWWSHIPPIWYGEYIYFFWWEDNGWICRFHNKTKEFVKLLSIKKD